MSSPESSESLLPVEILAGNFEHIYQNGLRAKESAHFGDVLRRGGGICWAASMGMAVSSLTGRDSYKILDQLGRITYDYFPKHIADLQENLRNEYGREGAPPFLEEGIRAFVDNYTGNINSAFILEHPTQTANMFNYFLHHQMDAPELNLSINPASLLLPNNWLKEVNENFSERKVPLLSVYLKIVNKTTKEDSLSGHTVFISGIEQTEERLTRLRISDPNDEKSFWLDSHDLGILTMKGLTYRENKTNIVIVKPSSLGSLIWIEKSN